MQSTISTEPKGPSIVPSLPDRVIVWARQLASIAAAVPIVFTIGYSLYRLLAMSEPAAAAVADTCNIFLIPFLLIQNILIRREVSAQKEILQAKKQFCRFVSHEVRGPLNSVCSKYSGRLSCISCLLLTVCRPFNLGVTGRYGAHIAGRRNQREARRTCDDQQK